MGYRIKNSNQFESWESGTYLNPTDILPGQPGSNLLNEDSKQLQGSETIEITLFLRRNNFAGGKPPKGFIDSEAILNLPYKKQVKYINSLSKGDARTWYGASQDDLEATLNYLTQHNANLKEWSQEQRTIKASLSLDDFKQAFLANNPEAIIKFDERLFYYDPANFANSYLEATGEGAEIFSRAIIGTQVNLAQIENQGGSKYEETESNESNSNDPTTNRPEGSTFMYYPTEIAEQYNFPSLKETKGGKNVTIGLVGTGGNQFASVLGKKNAFNKYLRAQGINTKKLGNIHSPNDPEDFNNNEWYSESAMDYSILRSVAPYADLIVSKNGDLYTKLAELVYNNKIDIISSSEGIDTWTFNLKDAYHELYLDALIRGKSLVQSAGDSGTGNNASSVTAVRPSGAPLPWFFTGDSALMSIGGTAFSPKVQQKTWARPTVNTPTVMPPKLSRKEIDSITGLTNRQDTWNEYTRGEITLSEHPHDVSVYPTSDTPFSLADFEDAPTFNGYFDNTTASSGVFSSDTIRMPAYQRRNLEQQWLGSGRRYPDISVLAGGNNESAAKSYYYTFTAKPNRENTAYEPVLSKGGGTSAGAPLIAGLLARLAASIKDRFGKHAKIGLINPLLYESYNSKQRKKILIDVPAGSNNASVFSLANDPKTWSGTAIVYRDPTNHAYLIPVNGTAPGGQLDTNLSSTGKGFDAATGLGSINGEGLLDELIGIFSQL